MSEARFRAFSAGSKPGGQVNPFALELLQSKGIACDSARSKSWDEFAVADAPKMDVIITVCDAAAAESCPYWPGHPVTSHWGVPDPAAVQGSDTDKREAFAIAFDRLSRRIDQLRGLSVDQFDSATLKSILDKIGKN